MSTRFRILGWKQKVISPWPRSNLYSRDSSDAPIILQLREMLLRFLSRPPVTDAVAAELIQHETCGVLVVGFTSFYPQPHEQSTLVLDLLHVPGHRSTGMQRLLATLLSQLEEWSS